MIVKEIINFLKENNFEYIVIDYVSLYTGSKMAQIKVQTKYSLFIIYAPKKKTEKVDDTASIKAGKWDEEYNDFTVRQNKEIKNLDELSSVIKKQLSYKGEHYG